MDKIIWRIMGHNEVFYPLNQYMMKSYYCFYLFHSNQQNLFFKACKYGKIDVVKFLLTIDGVDPTVDNNYAIFT